MCFPSVHAPVSGFVAAFLAALALAPSAAAQCETFGPIATGFQDSQAQMYAQEWSQLARVQGGWLAVWSAGQDIVLRRLDPDFVPASNDTLVNSTLNAEVQDEPAVCVATGGNQLICWSERHGYDGQLMGIFGRVYSPGGVALGSEFEVNQIWQASQWRPLIAPTPSGGIVVTWSGDWDGNAYFRLLSSAGAPLSNDVLVNQYTADAQVDPAVAVASDGTMLVAFVDFSGHGGVGSGLNLWARRFDASGTALGNEFVITSPAFSSGDQRLPRVAVDGQDRFLVVWESELADGSGYGIVAKRFASSGVPLSAELVINTTTSGDQLEPRVAMEPDGDFIVSWEDHSTGSSRTMCRRFDAALQPKDGESAIHDGPQPSYRPEIALDAQEVVFAYDVDNGMDTDVYVRRFEESSGPQTFGTPKTNSHGCAPHIAWSGTPSETSGAPFTISASNILDQKAGMLFYGYATRFAPFQGGTIYVTAPHRTAIQLSGGSPSPRCTGAFAYDFNARIRSGIDPLLVAGRTITAQYYYRDPPDPAGFGSGLTDAVRFAICP
jgi:hypothetical protein